MSYRNNNWIPEPESYYRDIFLPSQLHRADILRDILLGIGLPSLMWRIKPLLILPPRANSPSERGKRDDLRRHQYVVVGIVTRGTMSIWWEGTVTSCRRGSVIVIPANMPFLPHATQTSEITDQITESHSTLWLSLHRTCVVAQLCAVEGDQHQLGEYFSFGEFRSGYVASAINAELKERSGICTTVVLGELAGLLTSLFRAPLNKITMHDVVEDPDERTTHNMFQEAVETFILSHYHKPILLDDIANAVGKSPSYVSRHYREVTGQTPFQFLRDIRLAAAKRLLVEGIPTRKVATMVGFADPLYFSRVFSTQCGETPQNYRLRFRRKDSMLPEVTELMPRMAKDVIH